MEPQPQNPGHRIPPSEHQGLPCRRMHVKNRRLAKVICSLTSSFTCLYLPTAWEHLSRWGKQVERTTHTTILMRKVLYGQHRLNKTTIKEGNTGSVRKTDCHKWAWNYSGVVSNTNNIFISLIWSLALFKCKRKLGEKPCMKSKIDTYTQTPKFSHFCPFSPQRTNQTREKWKAQPLFLKSLYLLQTLRSPTWAVVPKEADLILLGPTHPWQLTKGMLRMQAGTSRRGKKKYGLLSLYIKPKGIGFSKYFHTCCFARVLVDFSPASTELRQAVRPRGKQYVDPACTGAVTLSDSHTRQPQVLGGPQLFALLSGRVGFPPSLDFSLLLHRALCCSLWTQDSCSVCVCVTYCSAAAGLSPAAGFSTWDSGGIRYWTSSVLMATLSGWSHLLKCSKVLGESRRIGRLRQTRLINYLMIISVTQMLPSRPPTISFYNCFSLLRGDGGGGGGRWMTIPLWQLCILAAQRHNLPPSGHWL